MRTITSVLLGLCLAFSAPLMLAKGKKADHEDEREVMIIHHPGQLDDILYIPLSALQGHLRHGDCIAELPDSEIDSASEDSDDDPGDDDSGPYCSENPDDPTPQ